MATNHTNPPPIDYSSRDYSAIRADLITLIQYFLTEWTDHNQTDPGVAILGLMAAAEDRLNYYIDSAVQQSSIGTAITRKAIVDHAKGLAYEPSGPDPATVDLTLTIAAPVPGPGPLTVYAGETLPANTGQNYELDADVIFPFDGVTVSMTGSATEGTAVTETLAVSTGRANQYYKFSSAPVLDDGIVVSVNAVAWTVVEALVLSDSSDQVYYLQRDENDYVTVYFGDGVTGAIPPIGQVIAVAYRTGGGSAGQIAANALDQTKNIAYGVPPTIAVTFSNPLASTGGGPHESDSEIQENAPRNWTTQGRCVNLNDYVAKALQVAGVAKAQAYVSFINIVDIYIGPSGGGTAGAGLLTTVENALQPIAVATDVVHAYSAEYIEIVITAEVYVKKEYKNADVETLCNANVVNMLAYDNVTFGDDVNADGDIKFSNLVGVIENTTGVDYVVVSEFRMVPDLEYVTWNGNPVIQSIGTTDETIAETWTVRFIDDTTFNVTGELSGLQLTTGTIGGGQYISDDERITFEVVAGGIAPMAGDYATIRVSRYLATDNVKIKMGEIPTASTITLTYTGGLT